MEYTEKPLYVPIREFARNHNISLRTAQRHYYCGNIPGGLVHNKVMIINVRFGWLYRKPKEKKEKVSMSIKCAEANL